MYPLVVLAVFLGVTAAVFGCGLLIRGACREPAEVRLGNLVQVQRYGADVAAAGFSLTRSTENRLEALPWLSVDIQQFIAQAGLETTTRRFLTMITALAVGGGLLTWVSPLPNTLVPLAVALGALAPIGGLILQRRTRLKRFELQLPEALDLLARSLRAGHSLAEGMRLLGDEFAAPAGEEFAKCYEHQNLGVSWEICLDHLSRRVPLPDVRFFVTAMIIQRETGGDVAELLDKIARLVRQRFQLRGQVRALTAEGRLSGAVLLALPFLLALYMSVQNPDYLATLFRDPLGRQMVLAAVLAQLVGAVVIKNLVDIRV